MKAHPELIKSFGGTGQYRFLPKGYSTNSAVQIFGDYVVSYTDLDVGKINDKVVFFIVRSHNLADSFRTWFKFMWGHSLRGNQLG